MKLERGGVTVCCVFAVTLASCVNRGAQRTLPVPVDTGCEVAPTRDVLIGQGKSIMALDDTTKAMYAIGWQLRKDYRCGRLLFSAILVCGEMHPQPCDPEARYDPANPTRPPRVSEMPRAVRSAMRAAGGHPCFPRHCSTDGALALFELSPPSFHGDSARIGVTVFPPPSSTSRTTSFEHYIYVFTRLGPPLPWMPVARLFESSGHYGKP